MFKNLTKTERAWVLYDVGNSAFTMLACSLIPIWFKDLAIGTAPARSHPIRQPHTIPLQLPWSLSWWRFSAPYAVPWLIIKA